MSFVQAHFFSPVLGKHVALNAILPDSGPGPFPVYYLLHGLSDDYTIWSRRTRIESYVEGLPLIVVMPDGFRGFYTDNVEGPAYARYMVEDVVGFVERTFPAIRKRAGRCIGGLSMGGYGAMRLALGYADMFASANSHSGALGVIDPEKREGDAPEFRRIFGKKYEGSSHDLVAWVKRLKQSRRPIPELKIDCGTEDFLLEANRYFHGALTKLGVPHEYNEYPGTHCWDYWDLHVREALAFHRKALGIKP